MKRGKDLLNDLELLIHSRYRIIFIETYEPARTESLLKILSDHMNLPFFTWNINQGLKREIVNSKGSIYGTTNVSNALSHIRTSSFPAIYHFDGFMDYLQDKSTVELLREIANQFLNKDSAIIITADHVEIPSRLKPHCTIVKMPDPDINEFKELLNHIIRDLNFKVKPKIEITEEEKTQLLNNIKGLTLIEAEKILTKVILEDNRLTTSDIKSVINAKKNIIEKEGVLEYYPAEESVENVADLRVLKDWLLKRKSIIVDPEAARKYGLEFPKGVLLLGVPGCGKSLSAKAVATEWGLPLLKFDSANLYNKYIGETEKNFKRAIDIAEKMSPVILWIDEIEKAFTFNTSDQDGGVSMRLFGTFLSWMQDRKAEVFIVATANNVSKLPVELLRKGRFDEIFFVDLPDTESRKEIFKIHLKKRSRDPMQFDIDALAIKTEGFSGSEIEQVINSTLYRAFSEKVDISTELIGEEINNTSLLSVTMAEKIIHLREWAKERAVSAH